MPIGLRQFWALVSTLIIICAGSAKAEPGPTISKLMEMPVTLFDWGIYSLKLDSHDVAETLSMLKEVNARVGTLVKYDWDKNKIEISVIVLDASRNTDQYCRNIREQFQKILVLEFRSTSADMKKVTQNYLDYKFSHTGGFQEKNRPKDVGKEIAEITHLTAVIFERGKSVRSVACTGLLYDLEPSYKYYPER